MDYHRYGRTELMVSRVGFGSHHYDRCGNRIGLLTENSYSEKERVEHVAAALDGGINFLHCAHTIGDEKDAEIVLFGKVLRQLGRRNECCLAAQYLTAFDQSLDEISTSVEEQIDQHLRDLHTDHIEVFELNVSEKMALERNDGFVEGILQDMQRVKAKGKALHIGGVSHNQEYLVHLLERYDPFDTIGTPYNVLKPEARERLFPLAREKDAGTMAIQPFGKGRVLDLEPSDDGLAEVRTPDEGVARAALRWVLSDPNLTLAIPGMKSLDEIEENIALAGT
ncbi:MAG: aldo/keto reductase [Candidatus Latescibacteria bacterium]|jgi:hypothetical protein|nr:aldo/keto reductase [Candidatus Latescibacterota bacterium]